VIVFVVVVVVVVVVNDTIYVARLKKFLPK
jgi:hypothetical protein